MSDKAWFCKVLEMARGGEFNTGVCYTRPNSQGFSIVFGWQDGYDKDDTLIQQLDGGKLYTLCCKVAYNCDDLQCDYDYDWYMPCDKDGNVYDTEMAVATVRDYEWFETELKRVSELYDKGEIKKGDGL